MKSEMADHDLTVSPDCTIEDALKKINSNGTHVVYVVSSDQKLMGALSDGDIRRGLLNGESLSSQVDMCMNPDPIVKRQEDDDDATVANLIGSGIHIVPVLGEDGRVIKYESIGHAEPGGSEHAELKGCTYVIMAGGLGTRLRPLTNEKPKPMVEVGGVPMIDMLIGKAVECGITNVVLCLNYKADMIIDHVGNGDKYGEGISVNHVIEKERLGTAGALSLCSPFVTERCIVSNSDIVTTVDFRRLYDYHAGHQCDATICVSEHVITVPYGVVQNKGVWFSAMVEKPSYQYYVNAGIYMLESEMMAYVPKQRFLDMPSLFRTIDENNRRISVFPVHEYWKDIGHLDDLKQAREDWISGEE